MLKLQLSGYHDKETLHHTILIKEIYFIIIITTQLHYYHNDTRRAKMEQIKLKKGKNISTAKMAILLFKDDLTKLAFAPICLNNGNFWRLKLSKRLKFVPTNFNLIKEKAII